MESCILNLACPVCHEPLKPAAQEAVLCTACGSRYPAFSATVPVLVRPEDQQAVHSWLGGAPGDTKSFDRYVEVRTESPLTVAYYDWWVDRLLRMIPEDNRGPVAELMCGRAEVCRRLPSRFCAAAALDINLMVCEAAQRDLDAGGGRRVQVICASAGYLPLEDESVGVAVIQGALHHAKPVLTSIYREIRRVLKPGGVFVGSEPANDSLPIRLLRKAQYALSSQQGNDPDEDGFAREELARGLAAAGLRLESYNQFGTFAYVLMGNADLVPLLARSRNMALGRALLKLDERLERLPGFRGLGMASIFRARKEE